jgi:hypothetical protein
MLVYDKAADYRRQAQDIRAVARCISLQDERQRLFDDATRLEALAEREEGHGQPDGSFAITSMAQDDSLIQRADAVVAETARLRAAHLVFQAQVMEQVDRMRQIERELDPLLPHPPWELGVLRDRLRTLEAGAGV